ncbi:MAG: Localization factor PodJS, partial [Caulobacteraceae bacterium]|nr:Localization factor PodJS [Caulobacteraceae bacterium]
RDAHPAETFEARPEALAGDAMAEDLFAPARPRTTREVIEQARASARAAAEAGSGKKGKKGASLLSAFAKPRDKKSKTSLFGSAGVVAVIAIGAGGLGAASTAIWWLDQQPKASSLGDPNAGLEVMPMAGQPAARAAIALSPTTQPMPTLAGGRPATDVKAAPPAAPAGPSADALYREGAARIEKKDNGGLASLQKAADLGYAPAQFYLSKLYENGDAGLKKDPVQARAWTQKAANGGDAKAMYNLGLDYYQGAGGEQNYAQAAAWFTKASNAGLTDAQYNLALLYERGVGVSQNMAEAYRWYLTAARLEADPSKKTEDQGAANRIKAQLTADAAGIAERSAGAFQPTVLAAAAASGSSDVATVQRALNRLGYYSGAQDGVPSAALASAITGYQQDQGLTATGRIDSNLVGKLQTFTR